MKEMGLKSKVRKKYKTTTDSNHRYDVAENSLNRNFKPEAPGVSWVSDITYIKTLKGWLYLTTVIDLFDRKIIGWSLSETMHASDTVIPAFKMAEKNRTVSQLCTFHSDRGVQYACKEFKKELGKTGLFLQSMSRKGNCWDNAVAESFFKTLKTELVYRYVFKDIKIAKMAVFEYIEVWYNRQRLHSTLGYMTPVEYEYFYFLKQQKNNVA